MSEFVLTEASLGDPSLAKRRMEIIGDLAELEVTDEARALGDGLLTDGPIPTDIAMISGPRGLRFIKGFHDEALRGERKGCRSSRLGLKYRVMYEIVESDVLVKVVNLTAHDYRRG